MIKRVLFTTILAAQFVAFSATLLRTDDPLPCPDCDPAPLPPAVVMLTDDPLPCPDCDPAPLPPAMA